MAVDHYENFPVASVLLPRRIRQDVVHIYWFARTADDIADEGDDTAFERMERLKLFRSALHEVAETGRIDSSDAQITTVFAPLATTIARHNLPITWLNDLLLAFEQDVTVTRYANQQVLDAYCSRSANPVGRLLLQMIGKTEAALIAQSDAICTALQRINFLQDVAIDYAKGRIYLPQDAMQAAGVTEAQIAAGLVDDNWQALMQQQVQECRNLLHFGRPLGTQLRGRVALEIRLIIQGGLRVLEKLESADFDVFRHRPTLTRSDWVRMIWRALR